MRPLFYRKIDFFQKISYNIFVIKGKEKDKMRHLTREEELYILRSLQPSDFLDNGSSRAVYDANFNGYHFVVKIFLDLAGYNQTQVELRMSEEEELQGSVAEILAVGQRCILCECVDPIDYDIRDALESRYSYDEYCERFREDVTDEADIYDLADINEDDYNRALEVIDLLDCYAGSTSDNAQVGYGEYGIVAYDYGYTTKLRYDEQVGHMDDYVYSRGTSIPLMAIDDIENENPLEECYTNDNHYFDDDDNSN